MAIDWIIFIAAVIIVFLLIKAIFKMAIMTFKTAFQILILLIILRVVFAIMPQQVFEEVRQLLELLRGLVSML